MFQVVLLLCVAFAHGNPVQDVVPRLRLYGEERIVGGVPIKIADAPYQVSFQRYNSHMCGGSIISEYHILTAAHCSVLEPSVNNIAIGIGSEDLKGVTKHKVARNIYSPKYSKLFIDYDVAVLKLAEKLALGPSTAVVALATDEPPAQEAVMVSGWGSVKSGGDVSNQLNAVDINIIDRATCGNAYVDFIPISSRMICAGQLQGGKDSCQGDSGGPLVSKKTKKQVGIVSWGYGCAQPNFPGVYTNIADEGVQAFIQEQLKL